MKIKRAVHGLLLTAKYLKKVPVHVFENKRIAIIGPASSAYGTGLGHHIDKFDVVVRVNKLAATVAGGAYRNDIGTKTDVLFHSFFENNEKGGGPLNFDLFDSLAISHVVNPIPGYFGHRVIFNFYKKYLLRRQVFIVPSGTYRELEKLVQPYRPTTGLGALVYLLQQNFSELYISGFTFFKTPYGDGYRDHLKDVNTNTSFIEKEKQHNIDLEFQAFLHFYKRAIAAKKVVIVDKALQEIINLENSNK